MAQWPEPLPLPPVTEDLLREAVRRILSVGNPLKIVLFGSHARGTAGPQSDLDLLIIEEQSDLPTFKRPVPYYGALRGLGLAKDIVVGTKKEVEDWSAVPMHILTTALSTGRVLYERSP